LKAGLHQLRQRTFSCEAFFIFPSIVTAILLHHWCDYDSGEVHAFHEYVCMTMGKTTNLLSIHPTPMLGTQKVTTFPCSSGFLTA
jgi:hypothetical protein